MSVKLLKVSLAASLIALVGVSWYAFTKEDARPDIGSEVSVKTSDLWDKASKGDTSALDTLKARAEAGDKESQLYMAVLYNNGYGVAQSDAEAFVWFKKAAEQGDKLGQFRVGEMYYNGNGVAQSYADAFTWYKKAAEQGLDSAQFMLGSLYASGQGVAQSDSDSFIWYKKAAEQGLAAAQFIVGMRYYAGRGIDQSYTDAVIWFKKAAEQGEEEALKGLSRCPCETAHLLNVAYEASCNELVKSQQNKEKYLYRLGKVNSTLQAWANLNNHLSNCSSCGLEYKSAQMQYLYQTKSQLDAMHTHLENAVNRGLNGDNDSEDALIKIFEALNGMSKPLQNLPPIQINF